MHSSALITMDCLCEQLFLSALDGHGAHDGKKTVFQHLQLSNLHNLYNFLSAARKLYFSSKLALLYDQRLGHFLNDAIAKLSDIENL